MWRGLAASAVASAAAAAPLASSLGSQPQECLGPTLQLARERGAGGGPQMLTAGAACPPELGQQSSKLLPRPGQGRKQRPRPRPVAHGAPPHHSTPPSAWKRGTWAGPWRLGKSRPPASLGPHPSLPPPPQKGQGAIEVMGWRFPEGHGAKHGTEITVIMSTHPGQKPARRLPRPPGLARTPLPGGSDRGGKQAGFWLAPMRRGNWALGGEDCSGLWVRAGREQRGSVCVVCAHMSGMERMA